MSAGTVLLVLCAIAFVAAVLINNRLVRLRAAVDNAFAQIDVQLQRRHELVPNLVEVAKGYLRHENATLVAVTEARNDAESKRAAASAPGSGGGALGSLAGAEAALSGALGRLNVVMEAYPELRADAHMRELASDLEHTENRVGFARQAYSDAVMTYETARLQFPNVLIARTVGFAPAEPFDIGSPGHRDRIDVSFA